MGIRTCLDTLAQVVSGTTPVSQQSVRFMQLPDEARVIPMGAARLFDLTAVGAADPGLTGFRERRRHIVDLTILYPAHFGGGRGQEHIAIAEDVAKLTLALGESNVGLMAGVGIVYPPEPYEVTPIIPEGKDSPSGLQVTMTFEVETREV